MAKTAVGQRPRASSRRRTLDAPLANADEATSSRDDGNQPGENRVDEEGRSARKRRAIIEAATALFLRQGYQGTSMDEVAALAQVSKQTVYKHFADKEQLFGDIVLGITVRAEEFAQTVPTLLQDGTDVEQALGTLARRYVTAVLHPQIVQLRRLVIAEAGRFPALARTYYERAPGLVFAALAAGLQHLAERGLLRLDDPLLAANHLAFLIIGLPLDKAMFYGDDGFTDAELARFADAGVRVFLAAYGQSNPS